MEIVNIGGHATSRWSLVHRRFYAWEVVESWWEGMDPCESIPQNEADKHCAAVDILSAETLHSNLYA